MLVCRLGTECQACFRGRNFNNWDGRVNVMRKHPTCGVWDIFIPGLNEGEVYKFEVKTQEDYILVKSDPLAFWSEVRPKTASVVL